MTEQQLQAIRDRADLGGTDHGGRHDLRLAQSDRAALLLHVQDLEASMGAQAILLGGDCARMAAEMDAARAALGEALAELDALREAGRPGPAG